MPPSQRCRSVSVTPPTKLFAVLSLSASAASSYVSASSPSPPLMSGGPAFAGGVVRRGASSSFNKYDASAGGGFGRRSGQLLPSPPRRRGCASPISPPVLAAESSAEAVGIARQLEVLDDGTAIKDTLFCIHGWPDDARLWDPVVDRFGNEYRCLRVTLPHFAGRTANNANLNPWGYSFSNLADALAVVIEQHVAEGKKVTLVVHDWGSFVGFHIAARHPGLVSRIVAMDVGPPTAARIRQGPIFMFFGFAYQYYLALGFLIARLVPLVGKPIGDFIVRGIARLLRRDMNMRAMTPLGDNWNDITADNAYPYFWFHFEWLMEVLRLRKGSPAWGKRTPEQPCLFLHGEEGPPFHSPVFESEMEKREDCRILGLKSGHWIQHQQPEEMCDAMEEWFATNRDVAKGADTGKI